MNKRSAGFLLTAICILLSGVLANAQKPGPVGPPTIAPPVITSLYPSSVKAGSTNLVVFVTGQNFVPGLTTAQFNRTGGPTATSGPDRPTVVYNSQVLAFEVTAADLAQPGTAMVDVVTSSGNNSVSTSNQVPFAVLQ